MFSTQKTFINILCSIFPELSYWHLIWKAVKLELNFSAEFYSIKLVTCCFDGISPVIKSQNNPSGRGSLPPSALGRSFRKEQDHREKFENIYLLLVILSYCFSYCFNYCFSYCFSYCLAIPKYQQARYKHENNKKAVQTLRTGTLIFWKSLYFSIYCVQMK